MLQIRALVSVIYVRVRKRNLKNKTKKKNPLTHGLN